jgi:putative redox protein
MSVKIVTRMLGDELYESVNENGNKLRIDMRPAEVKEHQSPVESVLSAVAACSAVDIVLMLRKRKKTVKSFTIETVGERREKPPRSFTKIHITFRIVSPDVSEAELGKVAQLAVEKYCSVADSLKAKISLTPVVTKQ